MASIQKSQFGMWLDMLRNMVYLKIEKESITLYAVNSDADLFISIKVSYSSKY